MIYPKKNLSFFILLIKMTCCILRWDCKYLEAESEKTDYFVFI
ncbi:hypothetical protein BACEGG_01513 [Bacteroides eggerthii DSM 20697]|nr:hypothetical protein BACEGG_01513 [Bacteroides eggerthii DSM 20697]